MRARATPPSSSPLGELSGRATAAAARWSVAVLTALAACSGEPASDAGEAATCRSMVASAADVAVCVPEGPWLMQLSPRSARPISGDLLATADIELSSSRVAPPVPCRDCLDEVRFQSQVAGVALADAAGDDYLVQHRRARIAAGTRFRVRVKHISEFPFFPVVLPTAVFLPGSTAPCEGDAERCAVDAVCYPREFHCVDCDQRTRAECACRDPEDGSPLADGAECSYIESFDYIATGACRDAVCVAD